MTQIPPQGELVAAPGDKDSFHFLAYPAHLLVWMSDSLGQCCFVSPSWTDYTGRQPVSELGQGWLSLVHPEDRDTLVRRLGEAHERRQAFRVMYRYLREDGVFRWFVGQGQVRTSPDGVFEGHLCQCFDVTPYQEGEAEMERSVESMIPLLRNTDFFAVVLDARGRVQFSNSALARLLQYGPGDLIDCPLFGACLADDDRVLLTTLYPEGVQSACFPAEFESTLLDRDGQPHRVSWHAIIWREFSGRSKGVVLIGDDITQLYREESLTRLYAKAFEATEHAIVVTDSGGTIISINEAFTRLTGYSRAEALGNNPRMLQSGRHDRAFYQELWETLSRMGHWHGDVWDRRKDGGIYPKYLSISAIKSADGVVTNYVGIFYDNSERKTIEERLDYLAHYDSLTGLPNRSLLLDRLEQAIERIARLGGSVALLYLDLDHFKQVNDSLGHAVGDELLKAVALRMKASVRAIDTVARLGGDEFVVMAPEISDPGDAVGVAQKLLDALLLPYDLAEGRFVCTPSIGVSLFPFDGRTSAELMRQADSAMYQAKQCGRGNFKLAAATPPEPPAGAFN